MTFAPFNGKCPHCGREEIGVLVSSDGGGEETTVYGGTQLCREHGIVAVACPYCELNRLRAENKEFGEENNRLNIQLLSNVTLSDWAREHLIEIDKLRAEVSDLRRQLAAAEPVLKAAEEWTRLYEDDTVAIDDEVFAEARIKLRLSVYEWREKK